MDSINRDHRQNDLLAELTAPALRALAAAKVMRIDQPTQFRSSDVAKWHGIGLNALKKLKEALNAAGLSFSDGN